MRLLLASLFAALFAQSLSAANVYVRDGGTGDGSAWNNALDDLPATLTRGNTYYFADGNYAGYECDDLESSTTLITFKKAIESDHGDSTGWVSTYGDGQAVFGGDIFVMTDNWVFDGQVGGGPGSWTSGHGFKATTININPSWNTVHTWEVGIDNGGDNVTINHFELQATLTPSADDGISDNNNEGLYISHVWTHDTDNCPVNLFQTSGVVWEYSYHGQFTSSEEHHAEIVFLYGKGDVDIRYNLFRWAQSTGGIMVHNPDEQPVRVYGNVFYRAADETWAYGGDGLIAGWSNRADLEVRNLLVYNNTFINIPSDALGVIGTTPNSGLQAKNNYFYNSDTGLPNAAWTADFNHYQDSGSESETNGTTGTGDPFTDYVNYDFSLEANTTAGTDLGATYNTDMLGTTRTTWTRGAIEFTEGGEPPASPIAGRARVNTLRF